MSRGQMFSDVVEPSVKLKSRRARFVLVTIASWLLVSGAFVTNSLIATDVLPTPPRAEIVVIVAAPPEVPPLPPTREVLKRAEAPAVDTKAFPTEPPTGFHPEPPEKPRGDGPYKEIVGGTGDFDWNPPPPPPPPPVPQAPVRVGGSVRAPQKIYDVRPAYSAIAQSARVQGIVIIEATIGPDGAVADARVLRSVPLLDEAALSAVRQWRYTPTLLNGMPVPVVMTVTVQFALQ